MYRSELLGILMNLKKNYLKFVFLSILKRSATNCQSIVEESGVVEYFTIGLLQIYYQVRQRKKV